MPIKHAYTPNQLRKEFDSWINAPVRPMPPIRLPKKKNSKTLTGQLANMKHQAAYKQRCLELYGGK